MLVYDYDDYRVLLKEALAEKKTSAGLRFSLQRLADAADVEKSYLSRVLNGSGQLSSEQLYLCCAALGFTEEEAQFCELLMQLGRASSDRFKESIEEKIGSRRRKFRQTQSHLLAEVEQKRDLQMQEYFLDPNLQIAHMHYSIPRFQNKPELVAKALAINTSELEVIHKRLEQLNLLKKVKQSYVALDNVKHLPSDAPIFRFYRTNVRLRAMQKLQQSPEKQHYSFNVYFSADEAAKQKIHAEFLEFLKRTELTVKRAGTDNVYQMVFDFLDWA